jgi:D-xylose 1-dehydrogenase
MNLTNQYPSLKEKRVVITGGATGIGAELVSQFVAQGSKVVILDRDEKAGLAHANETGSHFLFADVSQHENLIDVIQEASNRLGGLDCLVNNAANDLRHTWDQVTPDFWRKSLETNLGSQFFAMQTAGKIMQTQATKGCIVNLGSVSWLRKRPGMVAYTSSKAGIYGMTRTMAQELGSLGIRVNSVVPGAIKTPKQDQLVVTPNVEQEFLNNQALKFRLLPPDVAAMVLFLASDDARACSGQSFIVDGGIS